MSSQLVRHLKNALTSAPVLEYTEIGKQFILDTDASHESIGAVLSQEIDGQERAIAYFSKCMSKPERNYCVPRKELLAIDSLHLRNGVLYRKWESDERNTFWWQLILPQTRGLTVFKKLHGSLTGGHFGVMKHYKRFMSSSTGTMCGMTWKSVVAYVISVLHAKVTENALEEDCSCIMWERLSNELLLTSQVYFRVRPMATTTSWLSWTNSLSGLKPILLTTKRHQQLQRF
ncbi:retrovirus-related Pol polyprotein from transposon 412 [Trichonephila clavipes]|nr:retrovirus-related Pol polyprotein from transposon 412 [Trichonephila clavipes]